MDRKLGGLIGAILALALAGCIQSAKDIRTNDAAPKVAVRSDKPVDEAYKTVQANLVNCFAGPNYLINAAPATSARPPQIVVNSILGHLLAVVDFAPTDSGSVTTASVGYRLGLKRRAAEWKNALDSWLVSGDSDYCQRMP